MQMCASHADECVGFEHDTSTGACAWVSGTTAVTSGTSGVDCYVAEPDTVYVASHGVGCGGSMTSGTPAWSNGRLGEAIAVHHGLVRLHLKAWGCPPHS